MNAADATGSADSAVQPSTISNEKVREATGRTNTEWFAILDEAGARGWDHPTIARWLVDERGVDGWWAQSVTVSYEHARGTRRPGQQPGGTYSVGASKTVHAPKTDALRAVIEAVSADLGEPVTTRPDAKYATARWTDGDERVLATVSQAKPDRSTVKLDRSRMPEPGTAESKERLRAWLEKAAASLG